MTQHDTRCIVTRCGQSFSRVPGQDEPEVRWPVPGGEGVQRPVADGDLHDLRRPAPVSPRLAGHKGGCQHLARSPEGVDFGTLVSTGPALRVMGGGGDNHNSLIEWLRFIWGKL